jgi:membrane dipeptidase
MPLRPSRIALAVALLSWVICQTTCAYADPHDSRETADPEERPPVVMTAEGRRIHAATLLIDGHNDLPWEIRRKGDSSFENFDIASPQAAVHTDIPRLQRGNVGGQFWSVWVPSRTAHSGTSLLQCLEQIDLVKRMIERYPGTFELALTADDIERIRKSGKIASLIGVEGGHAIRDSLAILRRLYDLGARYMTLTHSDNLSWADSATDDAEHDGLTPFGVEVVREMNRLGMIVDLSHVSPETMHDALDASNAPIIFSHSSARAIADHPRNVPDDVLKRLKENGGVVMINFYSGYVVPESADIANQWFAVRRELERKHRGDEQALARELSRWEQQHPIRAGTIHDVVDHIEHVIKIAGIDHVGIGSDFDGIDTLPKQLDDVSSYPLITQELLNRGYHEEQIHKIMGRNVLRAMRSVEKVAEGL